MSSHIASQQPTYATPRYEAPEVASSAPASAGVFAGVPVGRPAGATQTTFEPVPAADAGPGWSSAYAQAYSAIFAAAGAGPELAQELAAGIQAAGLPAAELDAGLEYFASATGQAEIAAMAQQGPESIPASAMVKLMAPFAAVGVAATGAVVYTGHRVRTGVRSAAVERARATAGDQAKIDALSRSSRLNPVGTAASKFFTAPSSEGAKVRVEVGLQQTLGKSEAEVAKLLQGTTASSELTSLAKQAGVKLVDGEHPYSLGLRIAQQQRKSIGSGITAAGAQAFRAGAANDGFNTGGGGSFRNYDPKTPVGDGWAAHRAQADRMGMGLMHPVEKFRAAAAATAVGPEATAMVNAGRAASKDNRGIHQLGQVLKQAAPDLKNGISSGIAARGTTGTFASGMAAISKNSVTTLTGKLGVVGAGFGAVFELPEVADVVGEHGLDSKEAGNAIGGATGRVAGQLAGFVAGQAIGTTVGTAIGIQGAVMLGAAIGTAIPVPIVGTVAGAAAGLVVGYFAGTYAGEYLGKAGEHVGDALHWVNEKTGIGTALGAVNDVSNKVDAQLDSAHQSVQNFTDKLTPEFAQPAVHAAQEGAKFVVKTVVNPLGAVKDAANAAQDVAGAAVDTVKDAWNSMFD